MCVRFSQFQKRQARDILSPPYALDGLGETNIVGLEFVQTNTDHDSENVEHPRERLVGLGESSGRNVVDEDGL